MRFWRLIRSSKTLFRQISIDCVQVDPQISCSAPSSSHKPCPKMASSSTQKPSSSSSSAPAGKFHFDVFLSFRGEDTRYNFTDHLFVNLGRMGINTFRDDQLERGGEIAQELLGTIEGSRCSVIVFSERYADSKWCLDELTKIMECKREMGQIVLPVFYHVDPCDVRNQTGSFGTAFAKHEKNVDGKKVQRWRAAMIEAGSLGGWHVKDGYESKHIEEISNEIFKRLNSKCLHIEGEMVGMDLHLPKLKLLLSCHLNDVRVVGIYGTGGIGKTTIARVVYNEIHCQFDGSSFLQDVRERSKKGCQLQLQQQLLNGTMGKDIKFSDIDEGINIIKGRLSSKKILIVIDDVDDLNQLQPLVRREWFGLGSRIIITTRDQHLLDEYGVLDSSYMVEELKYKEAIQLFNLHAFKQNVPNEDFDYLSKCMVDYAQGLPLALKVIGSSLHGMKLLEWESKLAKLNKYSEEKINGVLRVSYDELDEIAKKVFLDIACFFKGENKDFVLSILDSCNLFATWNIRVLCDRCLLSISNNMVQMHDLIQQMGWAIVREECPGNPCKWSRLWDVGDINKAFSSREGMQNIETISLDLSRSKELQLSSKALVEMKKVSATMLKLRMLKVYYSAHHSPMKKEYKVFLPEDFEFPPNLIYLHWEGYTSECLPSNFHGENLVALSLRFSNIKELWKSEKHLVELKFADLSYSKWLIKIPARMPKLEKLNLEGCTSFYNFDSSIGVPSSWKLCLTKFLTTLNVSETRIKELPSSIGSLTFLEMLNLSGCSKFKKFPDIFANMGCLKELHLSGSGIKELPSSIGYLKSLEDLDLYNCSNFEKFPEIQGKNMKCLKSLILSGTPIKELPKNIGCLEALEALYLNDCSNLEKIPEFHMGNLSTLFARGTAIKELPCSMDHLTGLQLLHLGGCKNLRCFPNSIFKLKSLNMCFFDGCSNLEIFLEIMEDVEDLEDLTLRELAITELPSSIERLKGLRLLDLSDCENLLTLPNTIGNLMRLEALFLSYCRKLHKLPDSLRSLQFCLLVLDVGGCNLKEGAIPSDLWCLFSLVSLNVSENNIRCIPVGIIQLSRLRDLHMNHCPMLEEILELPSSLRAIKAHGCPFLENLSSDPTHLLWSNLLNCFKSQIRDFGCQTYPELYSYNVPHDVCGVTNVVIPGGRGIPGWVSHKSMGREIRIELPKYWYEDNTFLGFALFFHYVRLDNDDDVWKTIYEFDYSLPHPCTPDNVVVNNGAPQFHLFIFHGDQFEHVNTILFDWNCEDNVFYYRSASKYRGSTSSLDPALRVAYFPQIAISSKYRTRGWNGFMACFHGSFKCGEAFKVESCGIHLIYDDAQDHHQQSPQPFYVKRSRDDIEDHPLKKKSRHCLVSSSFHQDYVEGSCDNVGGPEKNHPPTIQYVNSVPGMQDDAPKHIPQLDLLGDFGEHGSVVEDTNGDADHKGHSTFGDDAQVHDDDEDDLVFRWQMMMMM